MDKDLPENETSVFVDPYFRDIQTDIWNHERNKTMKCLIIIAIVLLIGDLLNMARTDAFTSGDFVYALVFPIIYTALGIFARVNPVIAVIIAAIVFTGLIGLMIYAFGMMGILMGFLGKAAIIYLLFRVYKHAQDAREAQRNLALPF